MEIVVIVKTISRFNGQLDVEYTGIVDSEIYNESFYLLQNGYAHKWAVEKRTGTSFVSQTIDNKQARIVDAGNVILIISASGVTIYDKKTKKYKVQPVSGGSPGSVVSAQNVSGKTITVSVNPAPFTAGDIIVASNGFQYVVSNVSGDKVTVDKEVTSIKPGDTLSTLTIAAGAPWPLEEIFNVDFQETKDGLLAAHPSYPLKVIDANGNISDYSLSGAPSTNPSSVIVHANRLFMLIPTAGAPVLVASRVGAYNDFNLVANDATAAMNIGIGFATAEELRWVSRCSSGLVIGSENAIFHVKNRTGSANFDATAITSVKEISDIGASRIKPVVHNDVIYYVTRIGVEIAAIKTNVYYEDSLSVIRVSDYSDMFFSKGKIIKIISSRSDKHYMYFLTEYGYVAVGRPIVNDAQIALFLSFFRIFHFSSGYVDLESIRVNGENDQIMFCTRRDTGSRQVYWLEMMKLAPRFRKPEYYTDYYQQTNIDLQADYDNYVTDLLQNNTWLDASVFYNANSAYALPTLKYESIVSGGFKLSAKTDTFSPDMVGKTIRVRNDIFITYKRFIDTLSIEVFHTPEVMDGEDLVQYSYVTNEISADHLSFEDTNSLVAIVDGKFMHQERHHPTALDTNISSLKPYLFKRVNGKIQLPTWGTNIIIGIPYRFTWISNPLTFAESIKEYTVAGVNVKCHMSGDFMVSTTDTDYNFCEHEAAPLAHPSYYLTSKYTDVLSNADNAQKVHIVQESGQPLYFMQVQIVLKN